MKLVLLAVLAAAPSVSALGGNMGKGTVEGERQVEMYEASFADYIRATSAPCKYPQQGKAQQSCFKAEDGVYFRYGCVKGETRVYSDACTASNCDPSSCSNEWFWEGEEEATCYDDGVSTYNYKCHWQVLDTVAPVTAPKVTTQPPATMPGSNPCTWGPSYWCDSEENAKKCNYDYSKCAATTPTVTEPAVTEPAATTPPKACCMAMTAECLGCAEDMTASEYCNQPDNVPRATDCSDLYHCGTKEVFNPTKKIYCAAMARYGMLSKPEQEAAAKAPATKEVPAATEETEYDCRTREVWSEAKKAYCAKEAAAKGEVAVETPTTPPKACCMAFNAQCLSCTVDMTPEQYCNQPGDGSVQAPDCDQYFNCMTREVFNAAKQAYCTAQMAPKEVDCATMPPQCNECAPCKPCIANPLAPGCDACNPCAPCIQWASCISDAPATKEPVTEEPVAKEPVPERTEAPATAPVKSAKSCGELGWSASASGSSSVCAASKIGKACFPGGSLDDAKSFCESAGARLCTVAELAADEAKGSGCKADDAAVFAAEGVLAGGSSRSTASTEGTTATHGRCCADLVGSGSTTVRVSGAATTLPARTYMTATTLPARTYSTSSVGGIAAVARPYGDAHSSMTHTDLYRTGTTVPARTYTTSTTAGAVRPARTYTTSTTAGVARPYQG